MEENNVNVNNEGQQEEKTTYTAEEVAALLQSEADKRVTAALAKQKKKYEQKLSLSTLDEASRTEKEKDLRIQELTDKLAEMNTAQAKNEVMKVLSGRGLSPEFADIIAIGEDVEEAQGRIETLDKLFKKAVEAEVKKRLNSNTPKVGGAAPENLTKDDFKKMTLAQQAELYRRDRELYEKLCSK